MNMGKAIRNTAIALATTFTMASCAVDEEKVRNAFDEAGYEVVTTLNKGLGQATYLVKREGDVSDNPQYFTATYKNGSILNLQNIPSIEIHSFAPDLR